MIRLTPMNETAFEAYLQDAIKEYAQEHIRSGRWQTEEAYDQAKDEYRSLLPEGLSTPQHYLYTIEETETQHVVGMLWFALEEDNNQTVAFVYDVSIVPDFRRKGYATAAFYALEEQVRAQGVRRIRLHVFGHNHEARALYEKLGYRATNITMSKSLDI